MLNLYRLLTPLAWLVLMSLGRLSPKVRENIAARRGWARSLHDELEQLPRNARTVWIHCASMGEFEAIRPLARGLRSAGLRVVISFFSTSGPRHLTGEVEADIVCYLPFDTPWAARRFIGLIRPRLVLITKHDLWPNLLLEARRQGAQLWFINANFHSRSRLAMPWLRPLNREILAMFDWIAAVGPVMAERFERLLDGCTVPVEALGDSRFDRVVERTRESRAAERLPLSFRQSGPVLVGGSTWEPDERCIIPAFADLVAEQPRLRLLMVPHEPSAANLERLELELGEAGLDYCRLSVLEAGAAYADQPVLIVDQVGLLSGLYAGASLAWVGGGFTTGVHSVIEPAAFGLPVLFGPRHHVSQEAQDLLACGGAAEIAGPEAAREWLTRLIAEAQLRSRMAAASASLVTSRTGATKRLLSRILKLMST